VVVRCRIAGRQRKITDYTGVERVSTAQVILAPTPLVSVRDRVTLPVRFSPTQPPILRVSSVTDELGPHHQVVWT
jgi:hypothetical protein